ncbi:uncharacterized protein LOC125677038 isoform X2 [Ostrea edulis]|uniref:uncharacterized protein LOC125677038 isoform X2 n=1 Tax=Ostrea edulis TaxID=37623 RepID=UPI002095CCD4|nr:uncharacterized protein LOC125677038 isoform X2 [Ostrea edulis]
MAESWLDKVISRATSQYFYANETKTDVVNTVSDFKDLRPGREPYYFENGKRQHLLTLDGTIPVSYRGSVYNIPIVIWLLDTHPYQPPMVYVKPTSTMKLRTSTAVDSNGRVNLPYLRDWEYPQCDLLGLVHIMLIIFGEEPPVFSRRSTIWQACATPDRVQTDLSRENFQGQTKNMNEKEFMRFVKLLKLARDALERFFNEVFPAYELQSILSENEHRIKNGPSKLQTEQLSLLYPGRGKDVDLSLFGISTMYHFLRNYAEDLDPPSNGWGREPQIGQKKETDDVERIRIHRNRIIQMIEFDLDIEDFILKWEDLKQAILRLSKGALLTEVEKLST